MWRTHLSCGPENAGRSRESGVNNPSVQRVWYPKKEALPSAWRSRASVHASTRHGSAGPNLFVERGKLVHSTCTHTFSNTPIVAPKSGTLQTT